MEISSTNFVGTARKRKKSLDPILILFILMLSMFTARWQNKLDFQIIEQSNRSLGCLQKLIDKKHSGNATSVISFKGEAKYSIKQFSSVFAALITFGWVVYSIRWLGWGWLLGNRWKLLGMNGLIAIDFRLSAWIESFWGVGISLMRSEMWLRA